MFDQRKLFGQSFMLSVSFSLNLGPIYMSYFIPG